MLAHARGGAAGTRHHPAVPEHDALVGVEHDDAAVDEIQGAQGQVEERARTRVRMRS
jgi:hypothetical protein